MSIQVFSNSMILSCMELFVIFQVFHDFHDVRSKAVVLLLSTFCFLLLPFWESVIVQCLVVSYFMSILV